MKTRIFVAPKIKVGFQNREGTYTGKLAYIIYFDEKGKLRKEASWQSWRDHKIDPVEFDNVPTDGFTINKDIKRYGGDWFDSKRTMIRIHDPRGFEFEVTTENLIGILMHTDCLRRGLIGEFVYAWAGTELVLLPTSSEEYQNAVKYTKGLSKKVSAKDLVPGISYSTKREGNVLYIGRFNWYRYDRIWEVEVGLRKEKKVHVFTNDDGKTFFYKTSMEFLSEANNTTPVDNLADLISKFNKKLYANKIVEYRFVRTQFDPTLQQGTYDYYGPDLKRKVYFAKRPDEMYDETIFGLAKEYSKEQKKQVAVGYTVTPASESFYRNLHAIDPSSGRIITFEGGRSRHNYYGYSPHRRDENPKDLNYCQTLMLYDLVIVFENGKERKIEKISQLGEN